LALLQLRPPQPIATVNCGDELHTAVTNGVALETLAAVNADRATYDGVLASLQNGMNLQSFLLFFGYPRSGHSLVASLIDAHPGAAIANEFDAIKAYQQGEARESLFTKLVSISTAYKIVGRCQAGYHFVVPGTSPQPYGPGRQLRVIGDKMAGVTSRKRLGAEKLRKFQKYVGLNVSLLHVVRNPFDMVASRFAAGTSQLLNRWALQHNQSQHHYLAENPTMVEGSDWLTKRLSQSVDLVVAEMTYNMKVRRWIATGELQAYRWIDVLMEDFVKFPTSQLQRLAEFLGLDFQEDAYLTRAASIVRREEHASRDELIWPEKIYDQLQASLAQVRADYPDGAHLWTPTSPRHVGKFYPKTG
jgi:hypothetical protein